ncbi:MAG: hypothetical protein GY796_37135 [Chloroflexi bacterium]|nr:hypothetical protein [Chloroflexota bacterium]
MDKMTHPKWIKRDWIWIGLIGLAIQAFWLLQMEHPSYMDAYYYTTNGQRLADGYGFSEEVIWQYLDEPQGLPTPSHTYWMPLPSILAALGYSLTDQFIGAQLPFWLLAGLLPLLTYVISLQFTQARWQVWVACLFTAVGGYYSRFFNQPTTFAPFAWTGSLCLLFLAWGHLRQKGRWWLAAGLAAGAAHLTRADGVLFLIVGGLMWLVEIRDWRIKSISNLQSLISKLFFLILGYFIIMGGWFFHNMRVMGRPLPTAGTQTIFLTNYNDIFAYGRSFDLSHYLAWGWWPILQSKLQALNLAGQSFIAYSGLIFMFPFVIWAWVKWGQQRETWPLLRPLTWYALGLFAAMSLVFTWPGQRGGLLHSSAALWAWMMVLAAGGIDFAVDYVAARRSHWQPQRAKKVFSGMFLAIALVISVGSIRTEEDIDPDVFRQVGTLLPDTAVVISGNAPAFYYHTGLRAISVPTEPVSVVRQMAARYGAEYLLLDDVHPEPLKNLYENEVAPGIEMVEKFGRFKLFRLQVGE